MAQQYFPKIYVSRTADDRSADRLLRSLVGEGYLSNAPTLADDARQQIARAIQQSEIILVIITTKWLDQIRNPSSRVYFEAQTALELDKLAVPVVVDAAFPLADALPENLRDLVFRYGFTFDSEEGFAPLLDFLRRDNLNLVPRGGIVFPAAQGPRIYISYRWGDTSRQAREIPARLREVFGNDNVFVDVENMQYGTDFRLVLQEVILTCDVILAFIGQGWGGFDRRLTLQNPNDYVRIELEAGLRCNKLIIPVLVDVPMPDAESLPEELRPLTERQAVAYNTEAALDAIIKSIYSAPRTERGIQPPWNSSVQRPIRLTISAAPNTKDADIIARELESNRHIEQEQLRPEILSIARLGQRMTQSGSERPTVNLLVLDEYASRGFTSEEVQTLSPLLGGHSYVITTRTDHDTPPNLYTLPPSLRSLALYPFVPLRVTTSFIDLDIEALIAAVKGEPVQPPLLVYTVFLVNLRGDSTTNAPVVQKLQPGVPVQSLEPRQETFRKIGHIDVWISVQIAPDRANGFVRGDLVSMKPPPSSARDLLGPSPDVPEEAEIPANSTQVPNPPQTTVVHEPAPDGAAVPTTPSPPPYTVVVEPGGTPTPQPSTNPPAPRGAASPTKLVPPQPPLAQPQIVVMAVPPEQEVAEEQAVEIDIDLDSVELRWKGQDTRYISPWGVMNPEHLLTLAEQDVQRYGEGLFEALFPGDRVIQGYKPAVEAFQALRDKIKYWKIYATGAEQLQGVMWEFLRDPRGSSPFATQNISLTRGFTSETEKPPAPGKIKILVMLCGPSDLGKSEAANKAIQQLYPLNIQEQRVIIENTLKPLSDRGIVEYRILASGDQNPQNRPTLENLSAAASDYDVLHVLAHGVMIRNDMLGKDEYYLVLEQPNSQHHLASTDEIKTKLANPTFKLALLASCDSARIEAPNDGGRGAPFISLAPILSRDLKIPAVIGMQRPVSLSLAQEFTSTFYHALAKSGDVEEAVIESRIKLIRKDPISKYWGLPVLIMHAKHAPLFTPSQVPVPEPLSREEVVAASIAKRIESAKEAGGLPEGFDLLAKPQVRVELDEKLDISARMDAAEIEEYITSNSKLVLDALTYHQIAAALNSGKHIILIGAPGTGKTTLAEDICNYAQGKRLCAGKILTTATADWTTFDTVGGYVPSAKGTLVFRPGIFLEAIRTGKWLIIDELNRAEIDKAFGELFTVLSRQPVDLPYMVDRYRVRVLPPERNKATPKQWYLPYVAEYDYVVHPNWRIIGTMNLYDRQFLFGMSLAFARRFAFINIDLPSIQTYADTLLTRWFDEFSIPSREAFVEMITKLLSSDMYLMRNRALGPAIVRDMLAYVGDRLPPTPHTDEAPSADELAGLLGEAFLLYAVPQLDGLSQKIITRIEREIGAAFEGQKTEADKISASLRALYPHIPEDEWTTEDEN